MSGRILWEALEEGLYDYPNANGRFPHVAGAKIFLKKEMIQGEPKIYRIVVAGSELGTSCQYNFASLVFFLSVQDPEDKCYVGQVFLRFLLSFTE